MGELGWGKAIELLRYISVQLKERMDWLLHYKAGFTLKLAHFHLPWVSSTSGSPSTDSKEKLQQLHVLYFQLLY